jgi:molybdopterin molybdotransferase
VDRSANKEVGKKFSSNRFQLAGLIQQAGSSWGDRGSVDDQREPLEDKLAGIAGDSPTVIISTGGMGPGKYDLLEEIFTRVGGQTIFSSLRLRPGKSTLFGMLGESLYFGLPGPPPAVHALFHALVRPALMAAGGMKKWRPLTVRARLERDISIAKADTLRLHEGVLFQHRETCSVRLPSQKEIPNCYMYCQAGRKNFRRGSTIGVLPFSS